MLQDRAYRSVVSIGMVAFPATVATFVFSRFFPLDSPQFFYFLVLEILVVCVLWLTEISAVQAYGWARVNIYSIALLFSMIGIRIYAEDRICLLIASACFLRLERYEDSEKFFSRVMLDLGNVGNFTTLECAKIDEEKIDFVDQYLSDYINLDPENEIALTQRTMIGTLRKGQSSLSRAISDANRVVDLSPGFAYGYYSRARVYRLMNRFEECLTNLQTCLNLLSNSQEGDGQPAQTNLSLNEWFYLLWTDLFERRGVLDKNSPYFIEFPRFPFKRETAVWPGIWSERAAALICLNRGREAILDAEALIRLIPVEPDGYRLRAQVLIRQELFEEALHDLEIAEEKSRLEGQIHDLRSDCLRRMKMYERSLVEADKAVCAQPKSSYAQAMRALALLELGRISEAVEVAERATEFNGFCVEAWIARGRLALMDGDFARGKEYLDEAVAQNSNFADAYEYRARIYEKLGYSEAAETDRDACRALRAKFMT